MKPGPIVAIAFILGLIAFAVIVFLNVRRPDPLAEARQSGDPARLVQATATIVALRDTGSRHNHNPIIEFKLGYTNQDGRHFNAVVERPIPALDLSRLSPGKRVKVIYDAQDPTKADLTDPMVLEP